MGHFTAMASLFDILRFYRIHTGAATAALPTLAALSLGADTMSAVLVFLIAIFHHAWGFSLNELGDLELDRSSEALSHKPLVSEALKKTFAWFLSTLSLLISLSLLVLLIALNEVGLAIPMALFAGSTVSGIIYDMKGKRFPSDIFVAIWILLLVLSTSSCIAGGLPVESGVLAVGSLSFLQLLFNNSVEGGIKDIENDRISGARTMAIVLDCRAVEKGYILSNPFVTWGFLLRGAFVLAASLFSMMISISADWELWWAALVSVMTVSIFAHSFRFLKKELIIDRKELLGIFSKHEMASVLVLCAVVIPIVGIPETVIIIVIAVLWFVFMNRIMYGTGIKPGV
jgi:4-hydroxybenzoate polyprenyltransferase